MESISKKTGKKFTGKFAETAVRIGLADTVENPEGKKKGSGPSISSSEKEAKDQVTEKAGTITVPDKVNLVKGSAKKGNPAKKAKK